jgi:lysozyme
MRRVAAAVVGCVLVVLSACSSEPGATNECVGSVSEALRTCAKASTLTGVDVSTYQGNVNWSQVKASGRTFAIVRVSDGLNYPDAKFAQNWPGVKAAGLVRGVYQYFRPGQDANLQAKMLLDKVAAAGGLQAGDLPPVLDVETSDKLAAATVVARVKIWLTAVEKAIGDKPIIYTGAHMSDVIGTAFAGYELWVANYGVTCPLMPSGWTDWQFWQNSDSGNVPGISGNVDTDFFNGSLAQLQALTLQNAGPGVTQPAGEGTMPSGNRPNDGSEGATIGVSAPAPDTQSAPLDPCAQR